MPDLPRRPRPDPPTGSPGPRTPTGRALGGWVRPNLRGPFTAEVSRIETDAARTALTELRDRIESLSDPSAAGVLAVIDEALAALAGPSGDDRG
jgi:hypothetical protein